MAPKAKPASPSPAAVAAAAAAPAAAAPPPPAPVSQAGPSGSSTDEIDVGKLDAQKIKQLMKQDPRFITRLIGQLDVQMHRMLDEKKRRQEQIEGDEKELARLDDVIDNHVQTQLDKLRAEIAAKKELRAATQKQLEDQTQHIKKVTQDATAMITHARHIAGSLTRKTANAALQEARGFSSSVPTTQLIRGGQKAAKPKQSQAAAAAASMARQHCSGGPGRAGCGGVP